MPELPEVETVRVQLEKVLVGKRIENLEVLSDKSVGGDWNSVDGKEVVGVERRAKMLLLRLSDDIGVAIHFKMTGQLVYLGNNQSSNTNNQRNAGNQTLVSGQWELRIAGGHPTQDFVGRLPSKHTRAIFCFDDGSKMYFNDQRLFGWVRIGKIEEILKDKFLAKLGPEPLGIDAQQFAEKIGRYKRPVKLVLMDQEVVSGVGNIYANDALWEAEIDPRRLANSLSAAQYTKLYESVVKVLEEGIKYGGATAADAKYIDLHGMGGHYQEHFRVYDREGLECLREDGGVVHRIMLGGRGTYFCQKCQR